MVRMGWQNGSEAKPYVRSLMKFNRPVEPIESSVTDGVEWKLYGKPASNLDKSIGG